MARIEALALFRAPAAALWRGPGVPRARARPRAFAAAFSDGPGAQSPEPDTRSVPSRSSADASGPGASRATEQLQRPDRPILRLVARHKEQKGGDWRVSRRVPWIFRNEASNVEELRELGEPAMLTNVESSEGIELGVAACNLPAKGGTVNILARMLADSINVPINRDFFIDHIQRALDHREHIFGTTSAHYRLLNAEGDFLPGVICDRYDDILCLQFTAAAMEQLFEGDLLDALEATLKPRGIVLRCDESSRGDRKLELAPISAPRVVRGEYQGPTRIDLEDQQGGPSFVFTCDLLAQGWSSGRFFAERAQRSLLAQALGNLTRQPSDEDQGSTKGPTPRVLSLFTESLGLFCAAHGAQVTCALGLGEGRREQLEAIAAENHCGERVEYLHEIDSPEAPLQHGGHGLRGGFDIVTLEPPAFAPSYGRIEQGSQRYTAWVAMAAAQAAPGGLLLLACRSRAMSAVRLLRCVNMGIWSVKRRAKVVHRSTNTAGDFPIHLALPDMNDLQVVALRIL